MPLYPDFQRTYASPAPIGGTVLWLPYRGHHVLVQGIGDSVSLFADTPETRERFGQGEILTLGHLNGVTYQTCEATLEESELPENCRAMELRSLYGCLEEREWQIAGYAAQVLHWKRTSGFCPVCGGANGPMQKEWMRKCTQCGHVRYPPVSPAVLALVHDGGDRILLAHKPGWGDRYSILAGFVLPGESLEECVAREVEEEVGVQVTEIDYTGSQPWPFPHQLMVGFTARYVSGEICLDEEELDQAEWFDVNAMPPLPPPLSLSRQMIDAWKQSRQTERDS